ncbi:MAG: ABC transporter substrate-binding protein [Promethearchaeota archaeon]
MSKTKIILVSLIFLILYSNILFNYSSQTDEKTQVSEQSKISNGPIPPLPDEIIFGTPYGPNDADPQYMGDSASFDYAYQIWEGLYAYNLSDPELAPIPRLAVDFGTWSGNNFTVNLRQNVFFHSGTNFNATAVKFTFDRLLYLTNLTGAQGPMDTIYGESAIKVLYMWLDGTPILNRTEIINEYSVKFVLNRPCGIWLSLLAFTASMILDPEITPADDYIADGMTGVTASNISGTGPWIFEYYTSGIEVGFSRNDAYWRGPGAVANLTFSIILDSNTRNDALLNGDVDVINDPHRSYYGVMEADPDVTLYEVGSGTITQCLGMNNKLYNATWRSAISYAIDYDYLITNILEDQAVRLRSPIPLGVQFADWSYDVPIYNVTKAREYMQSMGFGVGFTIDADWQAADFLTVNYTYNIGNQARENFFTLLENNLDNIGITVNDNGLEWDSYVDYLYNQPGYNHLSLFWIGWMADYNDPSNFVNYLMSNITTYNLAQINDPYLEALMKAGNEEPDQTIRKSIYAELQRYVIEDLRPWVFAYVGKNYDAWVSGPDFELKGYPSNGLGYNYFYTCYWSFSIFIDDTLPEYNWSKTADENDWCNGSGTWGDPYIIEGLVIDGQGTTNGIEIRNSNVFFKIKNCTIYNGAEYGLKLYNVNNSILDNISCYDNPLRGISLEYSNNHTISNTIISNSVGGGDGISLMYSNHSNILNNYISNCNSGIILGLSIDNYVFDNTMVNNLGGIVTVFSWNITIEQNDIYDNTYVGIGLLDTYDTIINNNYLSNNSYGIFSVHLCFNNIIMFNQIYNHDQFGVGLDEFSSQNKVFQNEFSGNLVNAEDNGTLNSWDNGIIGNAWDDYIGTDTDDDGIGDTPHLIDGFAGSADNFPIYDDGEELFITINEPNSLDKYETDAPDFNITIVGTDIDTRWYTLDNGITNITFSGLTGTFEKVEWDKLSSGLHTIRFYVNNSMGRIFFDEVIITKEIESAEEIPGMNLYAILPIIMVAVIGLVLHHKKKIK